MFNKMSYTYKLKNLHTLFLNSLKKIRISLKVVFINEDLELEGVVEMSRNISRVLDNDPLSFLDPRTRWRAALLRGLGKPSHLGQSLNWTVKKYAEIFETPMYSFSFVCTLFEYFIFKLCLQYVFLPLWSYQ